LHEGTEYSTGKVFVMTFSSSSQQLSEAQQNHQAAEEGLSKPGKGRKETQKKSRQNVRTSIPVRCRQQTEITSNNPQWAGIAGVAY
jgi:hypothetical protein